MASRKDTDIFARAAKQEPQPPTTTPPPPEPPPSTPQRRKDREGQRFIGFHLPIEQDEQLRSICFYERVQKQDLLREAVNLLLEKRGQRQPTG